MDEIARVRQSFQDVLHGDPWHGSSLQALLAGVDDEAAAARPVPGAHSIWEIVLHVTGWQQVIAGRVADPAQRTESAGDWPAPPDGGGREAWQAALRALWASGEDLDEVVAGLPAERLGDPVAGSRYDVGSTLRGAIDHATYHAGQVALILRALGRQPA